MFWPAGIFRVSALPAATIPSPAVWRCLRPHVIRIQGQCFAEVSGRLFDSPEPKLRKSSQEQTLGAVALLQVIIEEQKVWQRRCKIIYSNFRIELTRREVQEFLEQRDRFRFSVKAPERKSPVVSHVFESRLSLDGFFPPLLRFLGMPQTIKSYTGEVIEMCFQSKQMFPFSKIFGIHARRLKVGQGLAWFPGLKQFAAHQKMCCYVLAGYQTFAALPGVESPRTKDLQSLRCYARLVAEGDEFDHQVVAPVN